MNEAMNETHNNGRDPSSGRFLSGNIGGGRPKGSRNRLNERFLEDLCLEWERSGAEALKRCASDHPETFVKVIAGLLPAKIDQTVKLDVNLFESCQSFHQAYELAQKVISGEIDNTTLWIEAQPEANGD
jgi:hypothetical protein